jgi:hypothetical protein
LLESTVIAFALPNLARFLALVIIELLSSYLFT